MNQPRRIGPPGNEVQVSLAVEKNSKNDGVNEIIALMREAATRLVKLGNALEETLTKLEEERDKAQTALSSLEGEWALAQSHEEVFEDWQELLLNLRSGIVDVGEVLAGTVGRSS